MKTKHFITLLLIISLGIISCDNNNDERFFLYQVDEVLHPEQAISGTTVDVIGGGSVGIVGGKAPYTAEIGDEQVATVKVEQDRIHISSVKLGTTHLVVKDANGLTIKIGVKVVERVQWFLNNAVLVKIEGGNLDEESKKALEKQVIADADMRATGAVRFTYDAKTSGTMNMIDSKENTTVSISAPFVKENKIVDGKQRPTFYVTYNQKNHEFYLLSPERLQLDHVTRSQGPMPSWLAEEVTEVYKAQYPTVTSVLRIYSGSLGR